jgi:hypothetical protein
VDGFVLWWCVLVCGCGVVYCDSGRIWCCGDVCWCVCVTWRVGIVEGYGVEVMCVGVWV